MAKYMLTNRKDENMQICGDICLENKLGKIIFSLHCGLCPTKWLQLKAFKLHYENKHRNIVKNTEINSLEEQREDKSFVTYFSHIPIDESSQKSIPTSEKLSENFLESKADSDINLKCQDPLEELFFRENQSNIANDGCDMKNYTIIEEEYCLSSDIESINENINVSEELFLEDNEKDEGISQVNFKQLIIFIIAAYEKSPLLWDTTNPLHKCKKEREKAIEKICESINKELQCNITAKSIADHISKVRYKFYMQLKSKTIAESKGEPFIPSWYYEKLLFLTNSIKYRQRNKRGSKVLSNEKPALPIHGLSHEQNCELIEIYKSYPCLWDVQHIGYRFKNKRKETIDEMIKAIYQKLNLKYNQDELQKLLYRIRYSCTQEKHRKLHSAQAGNLYKPNCKYHKEIIFLEENVGPFKCTYCDEMFNGADQFKIHKAKHDNSMPFICPICNRGFMKVGNCMVHMRRHTKDYNFICKECGKRYATSTDLNVHMRYHTGEKPYFCEICGQSFRTWTFFDAHMRRHQKRTDFKCEICSKAFYENNKLKEHMKAHLNLRDKKCNVCDKAFTSSKYLRQHKQVHSETKQYKCKICQKDFAQHAGLSGHMKSHGTIVTGAIITAKSEFNSN